MNYKVISENEGLYTVELEYRGNTYRSETISDDELASLDDATDSDIWRLLTPYHFFSVDLLKLFGFIE